MDDARFDDLARALARPASRRGALAALAALLPAASLAAAPASARRRRGCRPKCGEGFVCEDRACTCPSGVTCGPACCASGQACEGGACTTPEPPACLGPGEPCKGLGRPCCDGRTCASGQGGKQDVACYMPAGGACATTADCVYGARCRDGACVDAFLPCTVCEEGCPHTTIEGAVADPAYPVVTVAAGTYRPTGADESFGSRLVITRSVVIEACGNGPVTIDGGGTHRVVRVTFGEDGNEPPPAVTLRNIVVANGDSGSEGGGGVCVEAGSLVLDGATVRDSRASSGGGVYVVSSASLAVTGSSRITGNAADGNGGGVATDGDATLDIGGSTRIDANRCSGTGGGVFKAPVTRMTLRDRAAITGNHSADRGGGLKSESDVPDSPVSCLGAPSVCDNTAAFCQNTRNCDGAFDASCAAVCCAVEDFGSGEVGAALC